MYAWNLKRKTSEKNVNNNLSIYSVIPDTDGCICKSRDIQ